MLAESVGTGAVALIGGGLMTGTSIVAMRVSLVMKPIEPLLPPPTPKPEVGLSVSESEVMPLMGGEYGRLELIVALGITLAVSLIEAVPRSPGVPV